MWPLLYQDRLEAWCQLRKKSNSCDISTCLQDIDQWWSQTPWKPYYLHMDDYEKWPNPWNLLADNIYCDLARALGIVYTVLMLDRKDVDTIQIAETDQGNLVLVDHEKYILNWERDRLLNIRPTNFTITKSLDSSELVHLLG